MTFKRWRPLVVALALTAPAIGLLAYGFTRDPRAIPSPLIGRPAPTITLRLFGGTTLTPEALRGRVLIVNFWASWCYPACFEEAPRLQRVWERYRGRGVMVIGVNIQDQERPAREFIRRFNLTFPNGMDLGGRLSIDFGVYGVPETFIIEQDGRVAAKHVGAVPEEWMTAHVDRLLAGSSP